MVRLSGSPSLGSTYRIEPHDQPRMANFLHAVAAKSHRHHAFVSPESESLSGGYVVIKTAASALTLLLVLILLWPSKVLAQTQSVFKCIDHEGQITFQAVPCKTGMSQHQVMIEPAPPISSSPDYGRHRQRERARARSSHRVPRKEIIYSFECRTKTGALFYRHSRCPASIDRSGLIGSGRRAPREAVSARRIPRLDACRGMRSVGRDGREFDDVPSTYDRNLGRDPCRRY